MCGSPDVERPRPSRPHHPSNNRRSTHRRSRNLHSERHQPSHTESSSENGSRDQARMPRSLAELGYEMRGLRDESYDGADTTYSTYIVKESGGLLHIAQLSIITNSPDVRDTMTLFVNFINIESDSRAEGTRPRAREMLASFWVATGRSLQHFRRLYFETVTESVTRHVLRDLVCPLMRVHFDRLTDGPRADFTLYPPSELTQSEADDAWRQMINRARLVRLARGLLEFAMASPGEDLSIIQIDVKEAFDNRGSSSAFDLEILFGHYQMYYPPEYQGQSA